MLNILAVISCGSAGADSRRPHYLVREAAGDLPGLSPIGLLRKCCKGARLNNIWRLFIFTGFPGGFTTFSTFAPENSQLFKFGAWRPVLFNGHEIVNPFQVTP